jgi:glycosyltransferase involved in cell wall biosynthesis
LRILGIRGVPAAHGGFETFAEQLSLYLVRRGWRVIVYCQRAGKHAISEDTWQGIERINISIPQLGSRGSIVFDWKAILHAGQHHDLCLTLGYNTALLCTWLRAKGVPNLINMDGIEWRRAKWSRLARTWFWINDWAGCLLGSHLVADHPEIARHLQTRVAARKVTMIPYGAAYLTRADDSFVRDSGLSSGRYLTLIARAEPENSVLEIVTAFSRRRRELKLVVLGNYDASNAYHAAVKAAASDEVVFLGAVYDKARVEALRFHSLVYLHGHQVGGTNPSLVEALGAGNAVIAHDNRFNRWVAGEGARYFSTADDLVEVLQQVLDSPEVLAQMRAASQSRFQNGFRWDEVLLQYERLLEQWLPDSRGDAVAASDAPAPGSARVKLLNSSHETK